MGKVNEARLGNALEVKQAGALTIVLFWLPEQRPWLLTFFLLFLREMLRFESCRLDIVGFVLLLLLLLLVGGG